MARRFFLAMFSVALIARCGTVVDEHVVVLSINDPAHRLTVPIEAAIVERTSNELLKEESLKRLSRVPLRDGVTGTRVVTGVSRSEAPTVTFGVVIPKLSPDGYFLFTLEPEKNVEKSGQGQLVRFGQYFTEDGAMSVPVRYKSTAGERGWLLDVTIDVR